jgi:cardiolipin synthase A/B
MPTGLQFEHLEHATLAELRTFADQTFSRVAGAPLREGNLVRLLKDAQENYPAWLEAISKAEHHIHFENYIIHEDDTGRKFADALIAKARQGVRVRLIYDWMGTIGKASRQFWDRLREAGVQVRCYNPPRVDRPLGWLSRDHRKMLAVDSKVGFISGLCVGQMWEGFPEKNIEPWRDTGVEIRGVAVSDIERAFAHIWEMIGEPIPELEPFDNITPRRNGDMNLRIVASIPATAGLFRLDQLVAALARKRLWLTDSYFAGTSAYVQTLRAAAKDGVDVRLLVPNSTDIPVLRPLSSAGYRPLLKAGVRIFEWKGKMLHAKTAVADDRWSRIGSTNLNISSWFGNCELDAVVEDRAFALKMQEMYLEDLTNATEIVLADRQRRRPRERSRPHSRITRGGGSFGRATAGALRIGNAVGAAFTDRRVLEPVEARLMMIAGASLILLAALFALVPAVIAYPLALFFVWLGGALLYRSHTLRRESKIKIDAPGE